MTRKPLLILLMILFLTALQVQWASPVEGYDADNINALSPEVLGLYPGVLIVFLLAVFARRGMALVRQAGICTALLAVYWLLANYVTFELRVASWSTFSTAEAWLHVLPVSIFSILACGGAFFTTTLFILRQQR
ncbi:hypothetical protein [Janthinobacterium aquaticum]|uniref:hypothetical protein n=1 Tax=Janthinobacterium sp. FT58W TaxID=2654254 RepID=UPI001264F81D|nr:hypothetical protein [Janthinobacterium sp. FT58W]KAB8044274.1 hypothetical protein GCM43_03420 [Janthinobacterium sp. FT58W]